MWYLLNYGYSLQRALSGLRQFLVTESPLKLIKNAYFTLKSLFVLKIFKFLSWLFDQVEKRLDWKDEVNFKIYNVTTWKQAISIHTLINVSSKGNQAMKFGQVIEYNMRNVFLEKSYTKYLQILYQKIKIEHISGSIV